MSNPFPYFNSSPEVIRLIIITRFRRATSQIGSPSAGSTSATRPFGSGRTGSARCSPLRRRIITAYGEAETRREAVERGAADLFTRPIDFTRDRPPDRGCDEAGMTAKIPVVTSQIISRRTTLSVLNFAASEAVHREVRQQERAGSGGSGATAAFRLTTANLAQASRSSPRT